MVAYVLDSSYVPWAGIAMLSCHEVNSATGCDFELVHDGSIDSRHARELMSIVEGTNSSVRLHSFDRDKIATLPTTTDFGAIVWLRFFLPEILSDRSKVVYLDSDTFATGQIGEIWNIQLDGRPIGAVANVVEPNARVHVERLGVQYPGGFFNSGVLLMDLAAMRANRSTDRLIEFATSHAKRLLWPDQDALNVVFNQDWMSLHPKWNVQNSFWSWRDWTLEVFGGELLTEALQDVRVRHFEGPNLSKPWHYLCSAPMVRDYREMLRRSPWAPLGLEDRTLATRLIRMLPVSKRLPAYRRLVRLRQVLKER